MLYPTAAVSWNNSIDLVTPMCFFFLLLLEMHVCFLIFLMAFENLSCNSDLQQETTLGY